MHALDPIHLANGLSGVAFLALGLWVFSVRTGDPRNLAFGGFALAWASLVLLSNLFLEVGHAPPWARLGRGLLHLALASLLVTLALLHPTRAARRELPTLAVAAVLGAATVAVTTASGSVAFAFLLDGSAFDRVALLAFYGGSLAALFFLTLRWRGLDRDGRRAVEVTVSALGIWYAYGCGDAVLLPGSGGLAGRAASLVFPLLASAMWLRNAALGGGRRALVVAWLAPGAALAAMVERAAFPDAADLWGFGVSRLVGVAILAYAILRHQLLGIDVKARWTISKSTVAAAFVAAFFVASEGAQVVLGRENPYLGLIGAGALVFALAPLQRAAERLAERAVPVVEPPGDARAERLGLYRLTARKYLAHEGLSDDEEVALARIAQELGIGAGDAMAIRKEVEREARGAAAGEAPPDVA